MNCCKMDDILQEILLHLPIDALLRWRTLSKDWYNFISYNQSFWQSYESRHKRSLMLGFFYGARSRNGHYDTSVGFLPTFTQGRIIREVDEIPSNNSSPLDESLSFFDDKELKDYKLILGSSSGLLLLGQRIQWDGESNRYVVFNPFNKQSAVLPPATEFPLVTYGFTSRHPLATHGFTFDATTYPVACYEFKVVRGICKAHGIFSKNQTIETFFSRVPDWKPEWKRFDLTAPVPVSFEKDSHSTVISEQGVIYIRAIKERDEKKCLAVFDQRKVCNLLQLVDYPLQQDYGYDCFGLSGGFILYAQHQGGELRVWVLDETSRKWSMKHEVNLRDRIPRHFGAPFVPSEFIAFHPTDQQVVSLYVGEKKAVYDAKSSNVALACGVFNSGDTHDFSLFPYTYAVDELHMSTKRKILQEKRKGSSLDVIEREEERLRKLAKLL